ncbi:MAG: hypothetical protein M1827_000053 [Pycnora praestabilis]|nr:MAG: hypothetical protein M1827_000053 [Pycnora praestabilis]
MKTNTFALAAVTLLQLAAAQPHRRRHHHNEARQAVVTSVDYVAAPVVHIEVIVDQYGNAVSTAVTTAAASETAAVQVAASSPSLAPTSTIVAVSTSSVAASSASSASAPASSGSSSSGLGITYSPYNNDNSCKTQAQVNSDFAQINGYGLVRIYGVDCDQVSTVLSAAKAKGMKVFAGVFDITQVNSEIQTIISAGQNDWESFDTISIGNELINAKTASVDAVVAAIGTARGLLKSAGYTGKVVTVDTTAAIIANPQLCKASDYVAANCHAFFNADIEASGAGAFVLSQAQEVSQACGGMETVITESGWPWQGSANGQAVPGTQQQTDAVNSLKSSFSSNIILFEPFDDLWKTNNAGTFNAEQYWGFISHSS